MFIAHIYMNYWNTLKTSLLFTKMHIASINEKFLLCVEITDMKRISA